MSEEVVNEVDVVGSAKRIVSTKPTGDAPGEHRTIVVGEHNDAVSAQTHDTAKDARDGHKQWVEYIKQKGDKNIIPRGAANKGESWDQ